jgi:hypothetical protein
VCLRPVSRSPLAGRINSVSKQPVKLLFNRINLNVQKNQNLLTMNIKDKLICASYTLIALVALLATWLNNLAFMAQPSNASFLDFFRAVYVNAAAASFTNDLILVALAACIFMAIEGKRVGIRYFWLYIIMSAIIAVSVTFPLFLLARHMKIAKEISLQSIPKTA